MALTDDPTKCGWCNGFHAGKCPLVKAMEYHENGLMKRVEFYAPNDYPPIQGLAGGVSALSTGSQEISG